MGASNQYRHLWNASIWLHDLDARHRLAILFDIDRQFTVDFEVYGIEAYHVGGHTPVFTFYIYRDVLFICDYVFLTDDSMEFNPFGPKQETLKRAQRIYDLVSSKSLKIVCGYNYVTQFDEWLSRFVCLILK